MNDTTIKTRPVIDIVIEVMAMVASLSKYTVVFNRIHGDNDSVGYAFRAVVHRLELSIDMFASMPILARGTPYLADNMEIEARLEVLTIRDRCLVILQELDEICTHANDPYWNYIVSDQPSMFMGIDWMIRRLREFCTDVTWLQTCIARVSWVNTVEAKENNNDTQ